MDAGEAFRQGLGSVSIAREQSDSPYSGGNEGEGPTRIAHTLTACCRCRQVVDIRLKAAIWSG
jgi:hypothetical protein